MAIRASETASDATALRAKMTGHTTGHKSGLWTPPELGGTVKVLFPPLSAR